MTPLVLDIVPTGSGAYFQTTTAGVAELGCNAEADPSTAVQTSVGLDVGEKAHSLPSSTGEMADCHKAVGFDRYTVSAATWTVNNARRGATKYMGIILQEKNDSISRI